MRPVSRVPSLINSPAGGNRITAYLASLLIALAGLAAFAASASANTAVTANITTNTTWTESGSPYDLNANISVKEGATLTIEPGVTVDFNHGTTTTLGAPNGTIKAIGTAANPITFTSHQALEGLGAPGQYWGVSVSSGNSASRFSHANFSYGGYCGSYNCGMLRISNNSTVSVDHSRFEHSSGVGIYTSGGTSSTANISYSTIAANAYGIDTTSSGVVNVTHTTIANNTNEGVRVELPVTGSSFTYNTITGNESPGILYLQECTKPLASFPHGEYNNIYENNGPSNEAQGQLFAWVYTCDALPVDWRNNYWGSDVYYYRNDPECAKTTTPYPGHLAYTWSKPTYSYQVPKGPLSSRSTSYGSPYKFECGRDTFKIGPHEFLHSPVEGAPEPTASTLFGGEPLVFAPNLKTIGCADPVNCITGNFYETRADLRVPGLNGGLTFTRTYNNQAAATGTTGPLGYGWSFEFGESLSLDPSGQSAVITNAAGSKVTFTKDAEGNFTAPAWVQVTLKGDGEGGYLYTLPTQRTFHFDSSGKLLSIKDRNGNETTLAYTEGKLTLVTDPSERKLTFAYNAAGKIESVTSPAGRAASFKYDEAGNLTSVTDPGEISESYAYDANHQITSVTNPRKGKTTNVYDSSGRVTSQTDPMERKTTWTYNAENTEVTLPSGAVTKIKFAKNLPTEITRAYGTEDAATTKYEYDEDLNPIKVTDPNGHETTFGYDAQGNRTSRKDALGHETKWAFNETHDIVSITTPRGEKTTIERDAAGNPETISRPAPGETTQTTTLKYDSQGLLESVTNPLERTWTFGYDAQGDRTSATDPLGDEQTMAYDEDSRLTSIVTPRGNVEGAEPAEYEIAIERDARGRPLKVTDPLGRATEYAWDANGNLTSRTDAKGHTTKYTYDADDERTKVERPNGAILETGYDAAGRVISQTDANEHTTEYVRNLLGRPVEIIDPLERKTTGEYDAAGDLKAVVDPAERETSFSYDAANRLTKVSYSDGKTPTAEVEYDADGNVIGMADGSGESSYAYDVLDRLTQAEDGHGSVVGYEYDLGDQLTGIEYPNGKSISRAFDKAGRLESFSDWLGNTTSFAYNPDSALTGIAFPEGTGNVDEYAYDRADRMSEGKFTAGAETLASLSYTRDKLGLVESIGSSGLPGPAELAFGYDENNRLTKAGTASYEYDAADNLTKAPGTTNSYDAASQLEAGIGVAYSFDKLGERTKATPESGPATSYGYDQAGNLISVERPAEGEVPAIGESLAYDGSGLLASRTSGETTSYLTWDQGAALPLLLNDGQNSYIYALGVPIEQIDSEETPTYLHRDQLGSTRLLTNSSGEATGTFSYTPYGTLEASSGTATTPLGFAGQYTDAQSGLQYLRARFYDPATGQFLSRDPIEALTRQPYSYALDNPLNLTDPSGQTALAACLALEVPIVGEVACGTGAALTLAGGAYALAQAAGGDEVQPYELDVPAESNTSETDEQCSEPSGFDPWRDTTAEKGVPRQEMTDAGNFVDQLWNAAGSNPNAPYGNGPRWKRALAALLKLVSHRSH